MWQVSESIEGMVAGQHFETSDDAVDELIARVRAQLEWMRVNDPTQDITGEVALWFDDATSDLLKRYLAGIEGPGGDMAEVPTNNLHVVLGAWTFDLKEVA